MTDADTTQTDEQHESDPKPKRSHHAKPKEVVVTITISAGGQCAVAVDGKHSADGLTIPPAFAEAKRAAIAAMRAHEYELGF